MLLYPVEILERVAAYAGKTVQEVEDFQDGCRHYYAALLEKPYKSDAPQYFHIHGNDSRLKNMKLEKLETTPYFNALERVLQDLSDARNGLPDAKPPKKLGWMAVKTLFFRSDDAEKNQYLAIQEGVREQREGSEKKKERIWEFTKYMVENFTAGEAGFSERGNGV